jgi:hypothetical protein
MFAKPDDEAQDQCVQRAIADLMRQTNTKPSAVSDRTIAGGQGKLIELSYAGPEGVPLVSLSAIFCANGYQQVVTLTALRDRKNERAVRDQFAKIVESLDEGSFYKK